METTWGGTGDRNRVSADTPDIPAYNPRTAEHLWTLMAVFRFDGTGTMSSKNVMSIEGPGCYHCVASWSPQAAQQPCTGPK